MSNIIIRRVNLSDAQKLLEIYSYYVEKTAISFEYETPTLAEFENRILKITERYPYLVAERGGELVGYAYANTFIPRAAYQKCVELTIYLHKDATKCGIGKMLYSALETELKQIGITNLYACIGYTENEDEYLTKNSADFHGHLGFKKVGEFHKCGYKFDRYYDMIWVEKIIGEHKKEI